MIFSRCNAAISFHSKNERSLLLLAEEYMALATRAPHRHVLDGNRPRVFRCGDGFQSFRCLNQLLRFRFELIPPLPNRGFRLRHPGVAAGREKLQVPRARVSNFHRIFADGGEIMFRNDAVRNLVHLSRHDLHEFPALFDDVGDAIVRDHSNRDADCHNECGRPEAMLHFAGSDRRPARPRWSRVR
jgi:hypothetical protein